MAACSNKITDVEKREKKLRVLEFYSGIGGMHYAIQDCGFEVDVVAAFEINTTANSVYKHNFPETPLFQRNIEGLTLNDLDKLAADIFLMSPPCQPFTRVGLKGASSDPRCKSFLHILELLSKLSKAPNYILMENVKGFEESNTREQFVNTLKEAGYTYQEFLLSPTQFGIPNSRLRYYMLAKRKPHLFYFKTQNQVMEHIPSVLNGLDEVCLNVSTCLNCSNTRGRNMNQHNKKDLQHKGIDDQGLQIKSFACPMSSLQELPSGMAARDNTQQNSMYQTWRQTAKLQKTLLEFLEKEENEEYLCQFLLPEKVLSRFVLVLAACCRVFIMDIRQFVDVSKLFFKTSDIVAPSSTHSCCFTKAYGHYAEGTGSILKSNHIDDTNIFNEYRKLDPGASDSQRAALLSDLKLRYFTPREVANIMKFPKTFDFPQGISVKQQYRLLGNSLNVFVVTELLQCLLHE